jgi:hypothetical protein
LADVAHLVKTIRATTQKPKAVQVMRDSETIETELMEISTIVDDGVKLERIIAWCAVHPDEIPFALHQLMTRPDKHQPPSGDLDGAAMPVLCGMCAKICLNTAA